MMGHTGNLFHLADLLLKVLSFRADRQAEFDQQVEARTVEILRQTSKLTANQKRLLDKQLKAGNTLSQIRHDAEHPPGLPDCESEQARTRAGQMLAALDKAAAKRREWSVQAWANYLKCSPAEVPRPAAIVRQFDDRQIGKAIPRCRTEALRAVLAEQDMEVEDGDEIVVSIFDFVTHEILKRAPTSLNLTLADLGWQATRESLKALEQTSPVSQFLADLHDQGLTDQLLAECWGKFPAESKAIGLPVPGGDEEVGAANPLPSAEPNEKGSESDGGKSRSKRRRKMKDRTKDELFKAVLREHHQYGRPGREFNFAPASTRQIERLTDKVVSDSTARRLFRHYFDSVAVYKQMCEIGTIEAKLAIISGEGHKLLQNLRDAEFSRRPDESEE